MSYSLPWMTRYDTTKMDYLDFEHYFVYEITKDEDTGEDEYTPVGDYDTFDDVYTDGFLKTLGESDNLLDPQRGQFYDCTNGWFRPDEDDELWDADCILLPPENEIKTSLEQHKYYEFTHDDYKLVILMK